MSRAKEIFKMDENDRWIGIFLSFQPIIDSFGEVLLQSDRYDDSWILYRLDNNEYGCLRLDKVWDLQADHSILCACQTYEEVDAYIDELEQNFHRWPDALSALCWFSDYDWANDDHENKSFCIQAIKILQQKLGKMKGEEK
jgi:hypothetical protein